MSVTFGPRRGFMINALTGDLHDLAFRALLRGIDALLMGAIINRTTSAPPGSPANGDAYIVKATGTGAWVGHDNAIAIWTTDNPGGSAWEFYTATAGAHVYSIADSALYVFDGSAWGVIAGGGGGGSSTAIAGVNNQVGTAYTLVLGDAGFLIRMNNAAANAVTIPPHSAVAFPVLTVVSIRQIGAGVTSLVAGAGVTINNPGTSLALRKQLATVQLVQVAADVWDLIGDITGA
jgi:hypothetical protein